MCHYLQNSRDFAPEITQFVYRDVRENKNSVTHSVNFHQPTSVYESMMTSLWKLWASNSRNIAKLLFFAREKLGILNSGIKSSSILLQMTPSVAREILKTSKNIKNGSNIVEHFQTDEKLRNRRNAISLDLGRFLSRNRAEYYFAIFSPYLI